MGATIGIIQARMGSERLPGKILAPLAGRPLLALLCERIRPAQVDEWWLATSSSPADDVTEAWGFELGLRVFRGHPEDVLSRFVAIGAETGADWLLRVTADNPFLDAPAIEAVLALRDSCEGAKQADLLQIAGEAPEQDATTGDAPAAPRLPVGYGAELVRHASLDAAAREIAPQETHHRTHVTSWLHTAGRVHSGSTPLDWPDRPDWRWTVDTYEDLAMARSAFRLFGSEARHIDYPAMVSRLDAHPEIPGMNQHIAQKRLEEG